jgi:hypothetical protein
MPGRLVSARAQKAARDERPLGPEMMAPCGMDCGLCIAHIRAKGRCDGCHGADSSKPNHCVVCAIKNCEGIAAGDSGFCYECATFPCRRLRDLDKRYRTKYSMSMLDNLRAIQESGLDAFVAAESQRWTCPGCGEMLSVHKEQCIHCGRAWR